MLKLYFRVEGKHGVYIFTKHELERALDRENYGVEGVVLSENQICAETPYMREGYVFFNRKQFEAIATTPPSECWICEELVNHTYYAAKDLYCVELAWLEENGFVEHLQQIVGGW